jgi:pyruvate,water dikinase
MAKLLLSLSDRYWPLRETGKATLLHSIDVARAASRRLGVLLAQQGRIAAPEDVAYLTVEELVADDGSTDWMSEIGYRRARREEYLKLDIPQSWDGAPAGMESGPSVAGTAAELIGIGGSPGVVEGVVRVINNPLEEDLDDGDILVCETTDPSWASLFLFASALVIDVGSAMSHGAIVAREMGVPCVINTRTGTRELRTGDRVRVNGSTGHVQILERAQASATPKEQ